MHATYSCFVLLRTCRPELLPQQAVAVFGSSPLRRHRLPKGHGRKRLLHWEPGALGCHTQRCISYAHAPVWTINMHVDECVNASHMQVRGRKRLLLWEPGALGMLKMYPALHILRRRARLCPTRAGDLAAHPSFAAAQVIEVLLWP